MQAPIRQAGDAAMSDTSRAPGPCLSIPDVEKFFLQGVSGLEDGKVEGPRFQNERLTFSQVSTPTQEDVPIVHQSASGAFAQVGTQLLAYCVQTGVRNLHDMEVIHNDGCMWQQIVASELVGLPHVHANTGYSRSNRYRQALQVILDGLFIPVAQETDNGTALDIGQDTTGFVQQIDFIDTQNGNGFIDGLVLQMGSGLTKEQAYRPFIQANIISNTGERPAQCLVVDVVDQAFSHKVVFIYVFELLKECAVTCPTVIPLAMNEDTDALCSDWLIHDQLLFYPMLVKQPTATMGTTDQLRLNNKVILLFIHDENTIVRQAQEVQGQCSHCRVLPHKFYTRRVKAVAREGRLQTVSTQFPDVDSFCRRSKCGEILHEFPKSP